jgi:hypothetical protein
MMLAVVPTCGDPMFLLGGLPYKPHSGRSLHVDIGSPDISIKA